MLIFCPPITYEGPEQHGISEDLGRTKRLILRKGGHRARSFYFKPAEQLVEPSPVLGNIYPLGRRTEYFNALFVEISAKTYGSLSAEGHNNTVGLFHPYYVHYVLFAKRLKIKPVGRIEVGGHRFGVVIDYNHLVAELFKGQTQCTDE